MSERQQERFILSPDGDWIDGDEGEGHSDYIKPVKRLKLATVGNVIIDRNQLQMIAELFSHFKETDHDS